MTCRQAGLGALGSLVGWLAIAATLPATLLAATLTVTDCGDTVPGGAPGQLRRLIDEAAPGDVIVIPACTIQLHGVPDDNANATGDLDVTKSLTIRGAGPGQTSVVGSDHPAGDRVFDVLTAAGPVEISDIAITGGRAGITSFANGGGVRNRATLTLARVHVTVNFSGNGVGGGIDSAGSLTIRDSTVSDNAARSGGGIYNGGAGTLTLANVTVSNNVASSISVAGTSGGGITNIGTLDATNVTIVGNVTAAFQPGASGIAGGFGTIRNSIIAHNVARVQVVGPAFASNCGPFTTSNFFEDINLASGGHNLSSDGTCGFLTGPGDLQQVDPKLGPLAANGGATPTHALAFGSPAIDVGDDAACPPADQRGRGRPADGTGEGTAACDMGAYEYRPGRFLDVPEGNWAQPWIEALHTAGVTAGCLAVPLLFCPQEVVTRAQMAVFLLRAAEGPAFQPPACGTPPFADVPCGDAFATRIAELARRGITVGCGTGNYCPASATTREEMAVFLLRAREGAAFAPPPCVTPPFADVPCAGPFAAWIAELARRGITVGCSVLEYCPRAPVKREEMAVLLVRTFGLPL